MMHKRIPSQGDYAGCTALAVGEEVHVSDSQGTTLASMQGTAVVVRTHEMVYLTTVRNGFGTPLTCVNFSPDGAILLAGSVTGEALAWDMRNAYRSVLANRAPRSSASVLEIVCSPRNRFVAVLTTSCELHVWCLLHRLLLLRANVSPFSTWLSWSDDERTLTTNQGNLFHLERVACEQCCETRGREDADDEQAPPSV